MVTAIGIVLERIVVRPLWNRQSTVFVMILATLAVQIVIERLTLIVAGDQPHTLPMFTDHPPLRLAGLAISFQFLWIVACAALAIMLLSWFLLATKNR
jgi:branched-chain amino acid transport system permease protein